MWVFVNDQFVQETEACISVFDQGLLYGDGIFETFRVHGGQIRSLDDHITRLHLSCRLIQLDLPDPEPPWGNLLQELCERNSLREAMIRLTVTRGASTTGWGSVGGSAPTIIICSRALPDLTTEQKKQGVSLVITSIRRQSPLAIPPSIKSLNYLNNILAKREATRKHAYDGLMLNIHNHIAECTTSNVFFVRDNQLCTPSHACGILPGITRKIMLELALRLDLHIEEGEFEQEELYRASECFLTNTGFGVLPVKTIDTHPMGPYGENSLTHRLKQAYADYLTGEV